MANKKVNPSQKNIQRRRGVEAERPEYLECHYCGKHVKANALRCRSCGKWYSSGKKAIFAIVVVIVIAILLFFALQSFFGERQQPWGGDYNLNDWDIDDDVNMPEDDADFMGYVTELYDGSITVQTMIIPEGGGRPSTGPPEQVTLEGDVNIFLLDAETEVVNQGSQSDIQIDSITLVWGTENSDGTWHATDISVMSGSPYSGGPP